MVKNAGITVLDACIKTAFRLHKAYLELKENDYFLNSIFESVQDGISILNPDLTVRHVNSVIKTWYPEKDSFSGRKCYEIYQAADGPCKNCPSLRALKSKATEREEIPGRFDSPVEWLELFAYPMFDYTSGELTGIVKFARDITERKNMEQELLEQNALQQLLMNLSTKFINFTLDDFDRSVDEMLEAVGSFTGVDRVYIIQNDKKHQVQVNTHEWCSEGTSPQIEHLQTVPFEKVIDIQKAHQKREVYHLPKVSDLPKESSLRSLFEEEDIQSMVAIPLYNGKDYLGLVGFDSVKKPRTFTEKEIGLLKVLAEIITGALAKRQAEREIKKQLSEKEIMLKEIHHRINNNIISIENLLSVQAQSINHSEALWALQDAIGRISSMRILYDKLLLTDEYQDVTVKDYIESIIGSAAALFSATDKVAINIRSADFTLHPKTLFPLGIIINELITNSMKYAFIGQEKGLLTVSLDKRDNQITLIVQDNGVGLPKGFDTADPQKFGLMLVNMLSEQLEGTFTIKTNQGTTCALQFSI